VYGYVSESVVCLLELAYEYMNPNLGKNRGSGFGVRGSGYRRCTEDKTEFNVPSLWLIFVSCTLLRPHNIVTPVAPPVECSPAFVREKVLYPNN